MWVRVEASDALCVSEFSMSCLHESDLLMDEKFMKYYREKSEMLDADWAQTVVLSAGMVIWASLIIIGIFWVPVSFLNEWGWMVGGSFVLVLLSILGYVRKHWKFSNFKRWERSQRLKNKT